MTSIDALVHRLESYFSDLSELQADWQIWIGKMELAAASSNSDQLTALNPQANQLLDALRQSLEARSSILAFASESGISARSLESLCSSLPDSRNQRLRDGLRGAKNNLNQLRRIHVATWVMINQRFHHYTAVMSVLMQGNANQTVYAGRYQREQETALEGGGQLLDTNL